MREVMQSGTAATGLLVKAVLLNVVYLVAAGALFFQILRLTRKRGLLTKFATQ
jgi:ABC-2 type transport system permease protein